MRHYPHLTPRPSQEQRIKLMYEAIRDAETRSCSIEVHGPCHNPPVQGHIIPEARLETISLDQHVIVAELPPITYLPNIGDYHYKTSFRPVRTTVATTDWFSCKPDDQHVFQEAEQEEINWMTSPDGDIMKRLALLAYKAVLSGFVRQDRNARIWGRLVDLIDHSNPELVPQNASNMAGWERTEANRTKEFKAFLEAMIKNRDYDHMTHIVVQTGREPLLAANTFFTLAYNLAEDPTDTTGPIGYVPQFITAYPSSYGQTVIRSWITPNCPHLTLVDLGPDKAPERHVQAQACSILLLQQSEVIAISPAVWEGYGHTKQHVIRDHFEKTVPYSPSPIQTVEEAPEPQLLNLFNTTPLVS